MSTARKLLHVSNVAAEGGEEMASTQTGKELLWEKQRQQLKMGTESYAARTFLFALDSHFISLAFNLGWETSMCQNSA